MLCNSWFLNLWFGDGGFSCLLVCWDADVRQVNVKWWQRSLLMASSNHLSHILLQKENDTNSLSLWSQGSLDSTQPGELIVKALPSDAFSTLCWHGSVTNFWKELQAELKREIAKPVCIGKSMCMCEFTHRILITSLSSRLGQLSLCTSPWISYMDVFA